jgi:hypothetical protein
MVRGIPLNEPDAMPWGTHEGAAPGKPAISNSPPCFDRLGHFSGTSCGPSQDLIIGIEEHFMIFRVKARLDVAEDLGTLRAQILKMCGIIRIKDDVLSTSTGEFSKILIVSEARPASETKIEFRTPEYGILRPNMGIEIVHRWLIKVLPVSFASGIRSAGHPEQKDEHLCRGKRPQCDSLALP